MTRIPNAFAGFILALGAVTAVHAECLDATTLTSFACHRLEDTWNQGDNDLYVPFHTFHLAYAYTEEELRDLNSQTWGLGYGRSRYNEYGNWDGLYGMVFLDSHSHLEPIVGYGHQWMWGTRDALHAGLGYTVFVTARSDIQSYTPFPAILPIASISYDKASINAVFLPGGTGYGNIVFLWARVGF